MKKKIFTTDVWTESYDNHYECLNGSFIDGIAGGFLPYDEYKVIKNCNCIVSMNCDGLSIGNKHNAIIFYKNGKVVRLAVLNKNTAVEAMIENALNQSVGNLKLKEFLQIKKVKSKIVDLGQTPIYNSHNGERELDVGSCDRLSLLQSMLVGDYTEDKTNFGNYDCNEYDFLPNVEIVYDMETDCELFLIPHKGAFLNKTKTRIIIIQEKSSLSFSDLKGVVEN